MKPIPGGKTGGKSQNLAFNMRKKLEGSGKGPKSTDGGMDLSRNATNSLGKHQGNKTYSPDANGNCQARNFKTGNYRGGTGY